MADQRVIDAIKTASDGSSSDDWTAADLRGARLAGLKIERHALRLVDFEGADLSGASFRQVDLEGARFTGANLQGASFHLVNAASAEFSGARCDGVIWRQSDLGLSNLASTSLRGAMVRGCNLQRANLAGADLTDARLIYCNADDTTFRGARLEATRTFGTSFLDADFTDAEAFFRSRQILVEILRRDIGDDFERAKLVGAIAVGSQWCYGEWRELLRSQPEYHDLVLQIFRRYPKSGFAEALRSGWRPEPSEMDEREIAR